jgi:hypothetical protein
MRRPPAGVPLPSVLHSGMARPAYCARSGGAGESSVQRRRSRPRLRKTDLPGKAAIFPPAGSEATPSAPLCKFSHSAKLRIVDTPVARGRIGGRLRASFCEQPSPAICVLELLCLAPVTVSLGASSPGRSGTSYVFDLRPALPVARHRSLLAC